MARHHDAMNLLSGRLTLEGCQHCQTSLETLKALAPNGEPKFVVHQLDGVYVALCERCDEKVTQLHKRMFRGTPFGASRKIQ